MVVFIVRSFLLAFWNYRAEGAANVPLEGGVILASTHQSLLDPVMLQAALPCRIGFVARKTLFQNKMFGWLIRSLGAQSFDRDAPGPVQMRGIIENLKSGAALLFFPEGTRTADGRIRPLRPGIAMLARRAGIPVVPIAIEGTFACWPRHRKIFRPGRVRVVYGEPVTYGRGLKRNEILEDLAGKLAALQARAREMA